MLTLPTILNFHVKQNYKWKINFHRWVGGWEGLLENNAELSLSWV